MVRGGCCWYGVLTVRASPGARPPLAAFDGGDDGRRCGKGMGGLMLWAHGVDVTGLTWRTGPPSGLMEVTTVLASMSSTSTAPF
eukprot:5541156-Pyramimonas_sp.AAC.1